MKSRVNKSGSQTLLSIRPLDAKSANWSDKTWKLFKGNNFEQGYKRHCMKDTIFTQLLVNKKTTLSTGYIDISFSMWSASFAKLRKGIQGKDSRPLFVKLRFDANSIENLNRHYNYCPEMTTSETLALLPEGRESVEAPIKLQPLSSISKWYTPWGVPALRMRET